MTTATLTPPVAPALNSRHAAAVQASFARQVGVEARKLFDTVAGRWLVVAGVLLTMGVAAINTMVAVDMMAEGEDMVLTWGLATSSVGGMLSIFLGLFAVLTMTSEWSQRTALVTFTLEPRRVRVLLAKALVLVVLTLAMVAIAVGLGAASVAITDAVGARTSWDLSAAQVAGFTGAALLNTLLGLALGVLLQNSSAGIVAVFAVPAAWNITTMLGAQWEALGRVVGWVVPTTALDALGAGRIAGEGWWQLLVTVAVWMGVPAAVGTWRWVRREVA